MTSCEHDAPRPFEVCSHLLASPEGDYLERFTGRGVGVQFVCRACAAHPDLRAVCAACHAAATDRGWDGIVGSPEIAEADVGLAFEVRDVALRGPALVELAPVLGADRDRWLGLGRDRQLYEVDLDHGALRPLGALPDDALDLAEPVVMRVSRDGRLAAVANRRGLRGVVVDLETGRPTLPLVRDDDEHPEHRDFSLAFLERDGRQLLVHAPAWNRLDVVDARTGELLTARGPTSRQQGEPPPPHDLDYFHCGLAVSPDQRYIVDNGWVWHPIGVVTTWSVERWLAENVWESEDGPSRRELCWRSYFWDGPLCWIDDAHLAVYGYGQDDEWLIPAAQIFDVRTGARVRWFPGPRGAFVCDRVLVALDTDEVTVWDVARGTRLHRAPLRLTHFHPTARTFVALGERLTVARLRGHHAGDPWNTGAIAELAATIERERDFAALPVLGDALEQAGCADRELLDHCQHPGPHAERCWVLDRLGRLGTR